MPTRIVKPAHKCSTPIEALKLAEDMQSLQMAKTCIDTLDSDSIGEDREDARKELQLVKQKLGEWHRFAKRRMGKEFLSGN